MIFQNSLVLSKLEYEKNAFEKVKDIVIGVGTLGKA